MTKEQTIGMLLDMAKDPASGLYFKDARGLVRRDQSSSRSAFWKGYDGDPMGNYVDRDSISSWYYEAGRQFAKTAPAWVPQRGKISQFSADWIGQAMYLPPDPQKDDGNFLKGLTLPPTERGPLDPMGMPRYAAEGQPRDDSGRWSSGGESVAPPKQHNIALPKNPKRMTLDHMASALKQMGGYKGEPLPWNPPDKRMKYRVTDPEGKSITVDSRELADAIYRHQFTAVPLPRYEAVVPRGTFGTISLPPIPAQEPEPPLMEAPGTPSVHEKTLPRDKMAQAVYLLNLNNPVIPESYSVKKSPEEYAKRWMPSESFALRTVPIADIDWQGSMGKGSKVLGGESVTKGPIIIDANRHQVGGDNGTAENAPKVVVLDGQHRLQEARKRGEASILAWVGSELGPMGEVAPQANVARFSANLDGTALVEFAGWLVEGVR